MKKIFYGLQMCLAMLATCKLGNAQNSKDSVLIIKVNVGGIGCGGDMGIIKKKLINQEGIDEVTFTDKKGDASTFTVTYHSSIITEKKIREVIESAPCCDNPNEFPYKAKTVVTKPQKKRK